MIKVLSGYCPGYRMAFELSKADAAMNWDWPAKLAGLPQGKVWPTVVNNADSIQRFRAWAITHQFGTAIWHNEPPLPNIGAAQALAEWTNAKHAELLAQGYITPSTKHIVGNFLIQHGKAGAPQNYLDINYEAQWFMDELDFDAILGVHLYTEDAENPDAAITWHTQQLDAIRDDCDTFAVLEWGDLSSLWRSGTGPDIPAYSQYMRQCWEAQRELHCYASAWYLGCCNSDAERNADYVLTNTDGTLRPLGAVWRDLPTGDVEPDSPTEGKWVTVVARDKVWRVQEWRE